MIWTFSKESDSKIVVIGWDTESERLLGQPLDDGSGIISTREALAQILSKLNQVKAASVGLDLKFPKRKDPGNLALDKAISESKIALVACEFIPSNNVEIPWVEQFDIKMRGSCYGYSAQSQTIEQGIVDSLAIIQHDCPGPFYIYPEGEMVDYVENQDKEDLDTCEYTYQKYLETKDDKLVESGTTACTPQERLREVFNLRWARKAFFTHREIRYSVENTAWGTQKLFYFYHPESKVNPDDDAYFFHDHEELKGIAYRFAWGDRSQVCTLTSKSNTILNH